MARTLLVLWAVCFSCTVFSQPGRITFLLKLPEVKTDFYEMTEAGGWVLYLPVAFGTSVFTRSQQEAIAKLKDATIARIDLVYSDFPAGHDFTSLTKRRFETLKRLLPSVFDDSAIEFRRIRQTIAKTKSAAITLEHGFYIYFRPRPTKEESATEIRKLKDRVKDDPDMLTPDAGKDIYMDTSTYKWWCGSTMVTVDTGSISSAPGWEIPDTVSRTVRKMSIKEYIKSGLEPTITQAQYMGWDSIYYIKFRDCPVVITDFFLYELADTTVSTVFRRHHWNSALVIADVTGSMYPYTGQLLHWLKLNLIDKEKRHFIFFNDGDSKPDKDKIIGRTGGIYPVYTDTYDDVEKTIIKAMTNGSGGDAPENNIEALIEANRLCAACDSIIMIVDNWAPVKDISLLEKIGKPVKVVICGLLGSINKDYLTMVRKTKGSLHLMEEDIYNLSEIKEGGTITIHGKIYQLVKGEFVDTAPGYL